MVRPHLNSHLFRMIPRFAVAPERGTVSFLTEDVEPVGISSASFLLEVNGQLWSSREARISCEGPTDIGPGEQVTVTLDGHPSGVVWKLLLERSEDGFTGLISSIVINPSDTEVVLGPCHLIDVGLGEGTVSLGEDQGEIVFLESHGSAALRRVRRIAEDGGTHTTKTMGHLFNRTTERVLHMGFITFDRLDTEHTFQYAKGQGILHYRASCDFHGYLLPPGGSIPTEKLMIEVREDPYASLEAWADRVQARYQPRIWSPPPAGWVGWAWVDPFTVERYEGVVLRNATAIGRRLKGFGVGYIWVSIGNLQDGLPGNWLKVDRMRFPGGIENLVARLRENGLKLGFWIAPFWICSALHDLVAEMDEGLLRDEHGERMITRPEWQYGVAGEMDKADRPCCYALDGSHPKTISFLRRVFETYREWGIRYFMVDFLEAGAGNIGRFPYARHYDRTMVYGPEVYRNALRTIREAAGEDTYLLSSSGPTFHNVGLVDAVRVGSDYGEGRPLYPDAFFYPATFVINDARFWTSHHHTTTNMAANYFMHRKLFLCDSGNVMTVDKPIPLSDAQIAATIFGINGGPMMLGDDLDRISEERLRLIKRCLPRTGDIAFPVDLFDAVHPDYPKVFHLRIEKDWDAWDILALFNYGEEPLTQSVPLDQIGLDPNEEVMAWEFWNEQYMGTVTGGLTVRLPPQSARVYRLSSKRSHPWILSTDMHVLQGKVEVLDATWDLERGTLTIRATRPKGETGNLFVVAPKGLRVVNPQGNWIAKDAQDQSLVIHRPFRFGAEPVVWTLEFAPVR